jgi:hypothetical protein
LLGRTGSRHIQCHQIPKDNSWNIQIKHKLSRQSIMNLNCTPKSPNCPIEASLPAFMNSPAQKYREKQK